MSTYGIYAEFVGDSETMQFFVVPETLFRGRTIPTTMFHRNIDAAHPNRQWRRVEATGGIIHKTNRAEFPEFAIRDAMYQVTAVAYPLLAAVKQGGLDLAEPLVIEVSDIELDKISGNETPRTLLNDRVKRVRRERGWEEIYS